MGTPPVTRLQSTSKMKLLVLASILALASAEADADSFYGSYSPYGSYGSSVLPYTYATRGYAAPLLSRFPAASVRRVAAVPEVLTKTVQPAPAVLAQAAAPAVVSQPASLAVPRVVSTQYHTQDEDKNFAFGYSNINSARHEAGNAYTGVVGSYTDGRTTVNYVADRFGFRRV